MFNQQKRVFNIYLLCLLPVVPLPVPLRPADEAVPEVLGPEQFLVFSSSFFVLSDLYGSLSIVWHTTVRKLINDTLFQ